MATPAPAADRNLIFGLIALQMDFVTREQLVDQGRILPVARARRLATKAKHG
jgi:hypothetical protein